MRGLIEFAAPTFIHSIGLSQARNPPKQADQIEGESRARQAPIWCSARKIEGDAIWRPPDFPPRRRAGACDWGGRSDRSAFRGRAGACDLGIRRVSCKAWAQAPRPARPAPRRRRRRERRDLGRRDRRLRRTARAQAAASVAACGIRRSRGSGGPGGLQHLFGMKPGTFTWCASTAARCGRPCRSGRSARSMPIYLRPYMDSPPPRCRTPRSPSHPASVASGTFEIMLGDELAVIFAAVLGDAEHAGARRSSQRRASGRVNSSASLVQPGRVVLGIEIEDQRICPR